MTDAPLFWETKSLFEMSLQEWESLCDGCAKCCLLQLQDEETEQLVFTDIACELLDDNSCRCKDYENRSVRVPRCVTLNAENVREAVEFAPPSCAYRLVLQEQPLPSWHHLVTGSASTIHASGKSVRHRVRFERNLDENDLQDYIVEWPLEAS